MCAGTGYGKTSAVHGFFKKEKYTVVWFTLSKKDNEIEHFWDNYISAIAGFNEDFAKAISGFGFPDSSKKFIRFLSIANNYSDIRLKAVVIDNFHYIENTAVINFINRLLNNLSANTSLFVISRSMPDLNIDFYITENDLRFNKDEAAGYFCRHQISLKPNNLNEIMQDTSGWPFALDFIARVYREAPGYTGYVRDAMKINIFNLIEKDLWTCISAMLRQFLAKISLIKHFSIELAEKLSANNEKIIIEMEKQSAFLRKDNTINAYIFNPLLLEFLVSKQHILSGKQKSDTYKIAAEWCKKNGFINDALLYYEKIAEYKSIVSILFTFSSQIPQDIAKCAAEIFERTPAEVFNTVEFLAVLHFHCYISLGFWQKSIELAEFYEKKFLKQAKYNRTIKCTLCRLYFLWGYLRGLMCTIDDCYDMDVYIEKFCECLYGSKIELNNPATFPIYSPGPWINRVGSSGKGTPDKYIESKTKIAVLLANHFKGFRNGEEELARGELFFYRGDFRSAEGFILNAVSLAKTNRQFGILHMALFLTLRLNIARGNFQKAQQTLKLIEAQMDEIIFTERYINIDFALAWYNITMGETEKIPLWLKDNFMPYSHAGFLENFANQMKALYHYSKRNFPHLLLYIKENKQREDTFLFERVEMLAMEACIHYKMKDKRKALDILYEAYKTARSNKLVIPFMELGKDMRTLASFALREMPKGRNFIAWLDNINKKAAMWAKCRSHVAAKYRQVNSNTISFILSPRETDILSDLSRGLSRGEIAVKRDLSINTVKMVINNIYLKMGAKNLADLIRIAVENKMI